MADFVHGVETFEYLEGPVPVRQVRTAVVGLVGTAPIWEVAEGQRTVNELVIINTQQAAAQRFGRASHDHYTIPRALQALADQGVMFAVVVNVFDPAKHVASVTGEALAFSGDALDLGHVGVSGVVIKSQDGDTTYDEGDDYTLEASTGRVTRVDGGRIEVGAPVTVDMTYADPTQVTPAEVIGEVDPLTGQRTGMQLFLDAFGLLGFHPRVLMAPVFHVQSTVAAALRVISPQVGGIDVIDAPVGTTPQEALSGRGPAGTIPAFQTGSDRSVLCYPHLKVGDRLEPYSQRWAGVRCRTDEQLGYWWSASNQEIQGVDGIELPIGKEMANLLNDAGVVTIRQRFGQGLRTWGNRSAAWPTTTTVNNFISVRRTADIIGDSLEEAAEQFTDRPVDDALISTIVETGNGFIASLITRGAILDGRCWYDPADNPVADVALGQLKFRYDFGPKVPLERQTYYRVININYLANLGGDQQ